MNITPQAFNAPIQTAVNLQTDSLRRENQQREVIAKPEAANQSAGEKGVASDKERGRTPAQNNEQVDFANLRKQAEQASESINGGTGGNEGSAQDSQQDASQDPSNENSEQNNTGSEPVDGQDTAITEQQANAEAFAEKHHALFLGRGAQWPIAMEGALKLKEISYIHAESYPAGELKHGPLALVDADMPVIAVAPNNELLEKLKSNLEEVQARGGELFVFADKASGFKSSDGVKLVEVVDVPDVIAPIIYTLPLQLLSYHVAVLKGTDVDQPRNLAKSVTVE